MAAFKPLFRCRLCWRITFTVFALIFAVESALLIPSAERYKRTERQRLADQAQILIDPVLMRAEAERAAPDLAALIGHYGIQGVALYDAKGELLFHAGEQPQRFVATPAVHMAAALPAAAVGEPVVALWRSAFLDGASVRATVDARALPKELAAHLLRIAGLVAIIVLVVTIGTMYVLDIWVLRPLLRLRESSVRAGTDPEAAVGLTRDATGHGELGELIAAHNTMLRELAASRRRDREVAEERARFLAHHDVATGLPNRAALLEFLERRREAGATLFVLNMLAFRLFNASYGADAGDRLLAELARRVCATAEPGDFIARLGDDRFALARGGRLQADEAAALAERVLATATAPFAVDSATAVSPAMRIGIAKDTALPGDELIAQAELALARISDNGSATYEFFSPGFAEQARERQALARDLERAIERGELYIALQPKVGLGMPGARALAGAEVLLRWRHPARGQVSPAVFVPIAEATDLILPIGEFVLRASCAQIRAWIDRYGTSPPLAVNLSAHQFAQADLPSHLKRVLEEFDIPRGLLEIEITESSAMADVGRTAAMLAELRELGVRISIDDFGTGYSSLAYLRRFAVDAIKIDKSFVDDIGSDAHADTICDAILRLGQSLGAKVIAEGVEREDQAAFLRRRRCDEAQGWLFGKPVAAAEFEQVWLAEKAAA